MSNFEPRITVLVLGYNDVEHLDSCLQALERQSYQNFSVRFIDNASTDGSLKLVRKRFPNIQTTCNASNLGYAGAYAHLLRELFTQPEAPEAAVLLNPDVVVDRDWLRELVATAFDDDSIALAQPKVLLWRNGPSNLINSAGNAVNYLGFGFCADHQVEDTPRFSQDRDVSYPSGSSLLIKREPYLKIGGLEPTFFAYVEDQDLAWRARLMGYRVVASARSRCWHKYKFGRTTRNHRKFYLLERNRFWFLVRTFRLRTLLIITPAFFVMELGTLVDAAMHGYFLDKLRAYRDALRGMPAAMRARRVIQSQRRVADREAFVWLSPTVRYPEIDSVALRLANHVLALWYRLARVLV